MVYKCCVFTVYTLHYLCNISLYIADEGIVYTSLGFICKHVLAKLFISIAKFNFCSLQHPFIIKDTNFDLLRSIYIV